MSGETMWSTGPAEILKHGVSLLGKDTDFNRRLAMISIDNAVELMMQTYITLPKRITNVDISRKNRDEYCQNFPSLLDGIERHATEKIVGINLGEIEWFHRLRNELYHQGNGLTVERLKVVAYAEIAEKLFNCLFDNDKSFSESEDAERLGRFLTAWIQIERAVVGGNYLRSYDLQTHARDLLDPLEDSATLYARFVGLRMLRNNLVHGDEASFNVLNDEIVEEIETMSDIFVAARANRNKE